MKLRMLHGRPVRIGCTIAPDHVTTVFRNGRATVAATTRVNEGGGSLYERVAAAVTQALAEVSRTTPRGSRLRVRIAVMPPLAQTRMLALPPMREEHRAHVLTRDAHRYFFAVREPHVCIGILSRAESRLTIGAAIPLDLLQHLRQALPAHAHLDAALPAAACWAASMRSPSTLRVDVGGRMYHVEGVGGRILSLRLRRAGETEAEGGTSAPLSEYEATQLAASHVWRARELAFLTPDDWHALRRRAARRNRMLSMAAGVALIAGTVAFYLSTQQQLRAVRAQRAALRSMLEPVMAQEDSLLRITEQSDQIHRVGQGSTWSSVLPVVAARLGSDGQLVSISGVQDTVTLRLLASAAADVLPELRDAPLLENVNIAGAISREASDSTRTSERFDVTARVKPHGVNQ